MKRFSFGLLALVCAAAVARGQDAATQQQLDKLSGQIQDLQAALGQQDKRISAVEKEVADLTDKVNTPQVNDSASRDDLKKLAEQVQEIDRKRQADKELILENIKQLGKVTADGGSPRAHRTPPPKPDAAATATAPGGPQKGYDYTVKSGDTLSLIAKAYRDQGVKVTTSQIIKANPGLDPNKLYVGKKIFIPDPNAK
jgi:nucleoid-associated protein YgaU